MARIDEISNEIKTAFLESSVLQEAYGFDPTKSFDEQFSELSIEAADINIMAMAHYIAEQLTNADKAEMQAIVDNSHIGTAPWYVYIAKKFQWSDKESYKLTVDENTGLIKYNKLAPESCIITQAAVTEVPQSDSTPASIKVKIATGKPGELKPATNIQELNFNNYMQKLKPAGIKLEVVNEPADELEVVCNVFYDTAHNYNLLKEAITESLNRYSVELPYDGIILRNAVIDAIQRVDGVKDVVVEGLYGWRGDIREEIDQRYTTYSGYFNIKPESVITLIPAEW